MKGVPKVIHQQLLTDPLEPQFAWIHAGNWIKQLLRVPATHSVVPEPNRNELAHHSRGSPGDLAHAMDLLSSHPIKKADLGFHDNLFGGNVLAWMDAGAAGYAMRLCGEPRMLTLSLDCHFKETVKEGEVLCLYGFPAHLGRSSLLIAVEARVFHLATGRECLVLSGRLRFVCVNAQGKSIPISEEARKRITTMIQSWKGG